MTDNDLPPPEIQKAAAQVQAYLDSLKPAPPAPQPKPETAMEKFRRMPRADSPAVMPPYDPKRKD